MLFNPSGVALIEKCAEDYARLGGRWHDFLKTPLNAEGDELGLLRKYLAYFQLQGG